AQDLAATARRLRLRATVSAIIRGRKARARSCDAAARVPERLRAPRHAPGSEQRPRAVEERAARRAWSADVGRAAARAAGETRLLARPVAHVLDQGDAEGARGGPALPDAREASRAEVRLARLLALPD